MSQYNEGCKAFEADEAISQYAQVKLDADGKITVAGIDDVAIGTATREAFAAGDKIDVRLYGKTHKMIAVEALSAGAVVYSEASGKVQDTAASTSYPVGVALEAATTDGDIIEVMERFGGAAN
jgi:hypothetical protein